MCGIGGQIKSKIGDTTKLADAFGTYLQKRGPDNFSTYQTGNLFLAHARLKIIDLTEASNQPMLSNSGQSVIVFNGEIYNFKTIAKLLPNGNHYKSDTRVLIEAIELLGIDETLKLLNGMFAFSYTNLKTNQTIIARDRFGQKPLYYYQQDNEFLFSSDIRAISRLKKSKLTLNHQSIEYYLCELSMPQPFTIWNEVKQLEPAHYLIVNECGNVTINKKYWTLETVSDETITEDAFLEKLDQKLNQAIQYRTVSDVPLACFLSGGVDSGLIVSMLAKQTTEPIKTFTVGFDYEDFNEFEDAKLIADKYNTDHTEINIEIDIEHDLADILSHYGEPFADSSSIPTYYISKEIKKHVSVALSGDGGDELFGGYVDYGYAYNAECFKTKYKSKVLRKVIAQLSKLTSRVVKKQSNYGSDIDYLNIQTPYQLYRNMGFSPVDKSYLIKKTSFVENYLTNIWQNNKHSSMTTQLMKASFQTRLLNDYLVKVDRASMANSLEVRSPFLDYELAQFAFSMPNQLKFKNKELKYTLKQIAKSYMYEDVFTRKKRGFGIPIKHWLKTDLYEFAHSNVVDLVNRKNVVNSTVLNLLQEHKNGVKDHTHKIWALVCLEIWFKQNI